MSFSSESQASWLIRDPDAQMTKKSGKADPVAVSSRSGDVHEYSPVQGTWSNTAPGLGAILQVPIDTFVSTGLTFTLHLTGDRQETRHLVWAAAGLSRQGQLEKVQEDAAMQAPEFRVRYHCGPEAPRVHRPLSVLLTGLRGLSASPNTKNDFDANCTTGKPT